MLHWLPNVIYCIFYSYPLVVVSIFVTQCCIGCQMYYIAYFIPILWLLFLLLLHKVAFCAYAPRLWNELPDNIKAADSVQNFKKQLKTLLFRKEFNWLYGPWQLSNDSKALLNIIGGKGAISNINYYYYYYGCQMYYMADFIPILWLLFIPLLHRAVLAAKYIILQILLLSFCFCSYPCYTMLHWLPNVLYSRFYSYPFVIVPTYITQCCIGCKHCRSYSYPLVMPYLCFTMLYGMPNVLYGRFRSYPFVIACSFVA